MGTIGITYGRQGKRLGAAITSDLGAQKQRHPSRMLALPESSVGKRSGRLPRRHGVVSISLLVAQQMPQQPLVQLPWGKAHPLHPLLHPTIAIWTSSIGVRSGLPTSGLGVASSTD